MNRGRTHRDSRRRSSSSLTTTSPCANRSELLIRSAGWKPETFASAQGFLARPRALTLRAAWCSTSRLPDLNGLDLQKRVAAERTDMPIIFITGHGDVPMTVQAMKAGAVEFLTKPFTNDVLLDAIGGAIERSRIALDHESELRALKDVPGVTHSTRTRGDGVGRLGSVEQAGRRRAWHQRDHGQGAPRSGDAQDEGRLSCRPGDNGRDAIDLFSSTRRSRAFQAQPNVNANASTPGSRNWISNSRSPMDPGCRIS